MFIRCALATVCVALAPASSAAAATLPPPAYDWPAPATVTVDKSLDVAFGYWAARGIAPWPRSTLRVRLAHLGGSSLRAMAVIGGDTIWYDDLEFLRATRPRRDLVMRRLFERDLCTLTVHEVGHNWDTESSFYQQWLSLSGWEANIPGFHDVFPPAGKVKSDDGGWWHNSNAQFARDYGKMNPMEDWSTSSCRTRDK